MKINEKNRIKDTEIFIPENLLGREFFDRKPFTVTGEKAGDWWVVDPPVKKVSDSPDPFPFRFRVEIELHRPVGGRSLGVVSGNIDQICKIARSRADAWIDELPIDSQKNQTSQIVLRDFSGEVIHSFFWN